MSTQVMSKKDFLAMIEREIKDDEHVLLTTNIEGTSEVMKKRKLKRFPFAFASDAFSDQKSINDLFGLQGMNVIRKAPMFAVVVATDEMVADKFKHKVEPIKMVKCSYCMDSKKIEVSRIGYDSIMGTCPHCS